MPPTYCTLRDSVACVGVGSGPNLPIEPHLGPKNVEDVLKVRVKVKVHFLADSSLVTDRVPPLLR